MDPINHIREVAEASHDGSQACSLDSRGGRLAATPLCLKQLEALLGRTLVLGRSVVPPCHGIRHFQRSLLRGGIVADSRPATSNKKPMKSHTAFAKEIG